MSEKKQVIYIETDMTELPKGCKDCKQGVCDVKIAHIKYITQQTNNNMEQLKLYIEGIDNFRPSWCPLRTETELSEKGQTAKG